MAAVTVGAAALLAIYYLGFRDRSLAMLAPGLSALLVLALIPALVGFLVARGRRGNG
jgi:hypothetical protein